MVACSFSDGRGGNALYFLTMRTFLAVALASFVLAPAGFSQSTPAQIQARTQSPLPSQSSAVPEFVSPEVHADGTVTFRIFSPRAMSAAVAVEGTAKPFPLEKDERGLWQGTVGPLRPDYYSYGFVLDGFRINDPKNPNVRPNLISPTTVVHVTGDTPQPWDMQDIPHGEVTHIFYRSKLVKPDADDDGYRNMWVYTPPGYDAKRKEKYPVLYLNHGYSDDSNGWTQAGQANLILDSLLHDGKIQPMVVVMPLGYGTRKILTAGWARVGGLIWENEQSFSDQLLHEVIPMAEEKYNIARDREHRAIAGLSMGGGHSIYTGLNHPETFAYVGAFSSAVVSPSLPRNGGPSKPTSEMLDRGFQEIVPNAKTQQPLKLFWMSCGTEDGLFPINKAFGEWAKQNIKGDVQTRSTPGMHTWMVWRDDLVDFTPLLFR